MTLWTVCVSCLSTYLSFSRPLAYAEKAQCVKSACFVAGNFCQYWNLNSQQRTCQFNTLCLFCICEGSRKTQISTENLVEVLSRPGQTAVKFIDTTLLLNWHCTCVSFFSHERCFSVFITYFIFYVYVFLSAFTKYELKLCLPF